MLDNRARWLGLLLTAILVASAQATVIEICNLDDLVARSDLIVEGQVASTQAKMVKGNIETTVHLNVTEQWKGTAPSDDLVLTQLGGAIDEPLPIAQAVPGLPSFAAKEKVILFLSTKPPKVSRARLERVMAANGGVLPALWTSPKVVGGFQGKYNIYTDPKTKKQMVIRQSALAAQGTDPSKMPPEVQAKIAASLAMVDPGSAKAAANATQPAGQLSSPAPATAVALSDFRAKVLKMIGPEAANAVTTNGTVEGKSAAAVLVSSPSAAKPPTSKLSGQPEVKFPASTSAPVSGSQSKP